MATTMFIKHITFLFSLLLFLILVFPAANAMKMNDVNTFCKETADVDFCLKYIGTDKRIVAARDLYDVLLIALYQSKIQITNAVKELNRVRPKFSGPIGKERISYCERNYGYASNHVQDALELAKKNKVYAYKAGSLATGGSVFVRECEDEWKKHGPIQKSPVTFYNNNVAKMSSIIRKIIDKLY
ncbi:LOW QUALITY PROTEIN: pectinesterase inhibitor 5 [Eutrema salsugineum]|uniref:LOW QUALITY PROTEIN: pectinesterase inhibitor 5 n=1 Tax=Eutrema salsugineum TaxID=72664 RepID=UPI000CED06D5|nr:LOW QUALITY PROTEIN: pectinesterase inhibitor 5 [Eutrema salsugineum]